MMASLSYYKTFTITLAIFIVHSLATSNDKAKISCNYNHHLNPTTDSNVTHFQNILNNSVKIAIKRLSSASEHFAVNATIEKLIDNKMPNNGLAFSALKSCRELIFLALVNLKNSLFSTMNRDSIKTWLCAAEADLQTCINGFHGSDYEVRNLVFEKLNRSIDDAYYSGAIMASMDSCYSSITGRGKLDPYWLLEEDRRILQSYEINPNVVVAKDGSGNYKKISEALMAVPPNSDKRFVIYVKKGIYHENVKVDRSQWNVMMFGDGMNQTIVFGRYSYGGGRQTFDTATFTVLGKGFIARDMGFLNTAGPKMQQAVALLSASDQSVFYRCRIDGYQDTLYAHTNRQFYRECQISGTIDFIFGNAAVIIQKSNIYVKRPLHGQQNTITAHQKTRAYCDTGIVIQKSIIKPSGNLAQVSTFLGRPWSEYSTTVFMENYLHSMIDPRGWMPWTGYEGAPPPPADTIFLAEFQNMGGGANTDNRVKWKGVRANLSEDEARMFTVQSFINGDQWLPQTSISFDLGL